MSLPLACHARGMKTWIVRFASLYVFNIVLLLVIGALVPRVSVGWAALWAAVILTAATIWLKPVISKFFSDASRGVGKGSSTAEKAVRYGVVFVVELVLWILVVLLSSVNVDGFFWAWIVPPVLLFIGWLIYDRVDDVIEQRAGALYDEAESRISASRAAKNAPASPPANPKAAAEGRQELHDGLTPEQRKMLDNL